jgi:hypothetical protein
MVAHFPVHAKREDFSRANRGKISETRGIRAFKQRFLKGQKFAPGRARAMPAVYRLRFLGHRIEAYAA